MAEALALALLLVFAAKNWLGSAGVTGARAAFGTWNGWLADMGLAAELPRWVVAVLVPALALGLLEWAIYHPLAQLVLTFAVLFCLLPLREFGDRSDELAKAIYANDRTRALQAAAAWMPETAAVEDGESRMLRRLLGLCAVRLHRDLLAVLFWHALFGAGGAVMYFASRSFTADGRQLGMLKSVIEFPPAFASIMLFGLVGNFVPAAREVFGGDVERAALAAGDLDGDAIELERVPPFRRLLQRVLWLGFGCAAVFALLVS